jgi:hypothetical protein
VHASAHAQAANLSDQGGVAPGLGYDSRAERRAKFRCSEWRTLESSWPGSSRPFRFGRQEPRLNMRPSGYRVRSGHT